MTAQTLTMLFGFSHGTVRQNMDGITHEESLKSPEPGGNCINWVLGHIVATRNGALKTLGQEPFWTEVEAAPYMRGSRPLDTSRALPLEQILNGLEASQKKLLAAISAMPAADLEESVSNPAAGRNIAVLQFHDAYHAGQLGVLRRLVGKAGAIK